MRRTVASVDGDRHVHTIAHSRSKACLRPALVEPPAHLGARTADRYWITQGPDSGGVRAWYLWQGHLFAFEHQGHTGSIEPGIEMAEFCRRERDSPERRMLNNSLCDVGESHQVVMPA